MSLLRAVEVLTWAAWALFAAALAVRVAEVALRSDRQAAGQHLAQPLVDSVRVDMALQGLRSSTSDDLVAAVTAEAAARQDRSTLVLAVDPMPPMGSLSGAVCQPMRETAPVSTPQSASPQLAPGDG